MKEKWNIYRYEFMLERRTCRTVLKAPAAGVFNGEEGVCVVWGLRLLRNWIEVHFHIFCFINVGLWESHQWLMNILVFWKNVSSYGKGFHWQEQMLLEMFHLRGSAESWSKEGWKKKMTSGSVGHQFWVVSWSSWRRRGLVHCSTASCFIWILAQMIANH